VTSAQIRMARAALVWTVRELAERAGVHRNTIVRVESGDASPHSATFAVIRRALEEAGILFIEPEVGVHSGAVALRWGVEPALRQAAGDDEDETGRSSRRRTQALPSNPDLRGLYDYWRERPDEWQELSDPSRRAVLHEIFGEVPDGDPITDWLEGGENGTAAPL
jgi:transcriptional regulator with XRE-family HTH domain